MGPPLLWRLGVLVGLKLIQVVISHWHSVNDKRIILTSAIFKSPCPEQNTKYNTCHPRWMEPDITWDRPMVSRSPETAYPRPFWILKSPRTRGLDDPHITSETRSASFGRERVMQTGGWYFTRIPATYHHLTIPGEHALDLENSMQDAWWVKSFPNRPQWHSFPACWPTDDAEHRNLEGKWRRDFYYPPYPTSATCQVNLYCTSTIRCGESFHWLTWHLWASH